MKLEKGEVVVPGARGIYRREIKVRGVIRKPCVMYEIAK